MNPATFLANVSRFWTYVDRTGDCWLWTGRVNSKGYGRFSFWHDGKESRVQAHRLSLILAGTDLPGDMHARHACDTPLCVNPGHLLVGTQSDNMRDAVERNRMNTSGLALGQAATYPSRPCRDCGVIVSEGRMRLCSRCKAEATQASHAKYRARSGQDRTPR